MDSKESEQLSDRQIDVLVVTTLMGWKKVAVQSVLAGVMYQKPGVDHLVWAVSIPEFSTDIASAMLVEDRIAELGLQSRYASELLHIIQREAEAANQHWGTWNLIHAAPRPRCLAALEAVRAE